MRIGKNAALKAYQTHRNKGSKKNRFAIYNLQFVFYSKVKLCKLGTYHPYNRLISNPIGIIQLPTYQNTFVSLFSQIILVIDIFKFSLSIPIISMLDRG
jgi:hypothetical protein